MVSGLHAYLTNSFHIRQPDRRLYYGILLAFNQLFMSTSKRTSSKPKAVAATVAAPVVYKKKSESHIPTASVMWIAVLAIVFSFTGITLSALAKSSPMSSKPVSNNVDLRAEFKGITDRLDRIEKKVDALKAPAATGTNQ